MRNNSYMTIKEFSDLTNIKKENLRYYNSIGLLEPSFRGENGYRYYSRNQLTTAYLITSLRTLGVSIEDIKKYIKVRTPQEMYSLFNIQKENILDEINKLQAILDIMKIYIESVKEALESVNSIKIVEKNKEPIFVGPVVDSDYYDFSFSDLYSLAIEKGLSTGYPLGSITYLDSSSNNFSIKTSRFYLKTEKYCNSYKPKGKYIVLYDTCSYNNSMSIYKKLFNFIEENNLKATGFIYEEFPINQISSLNSEEYCIKLEVQIID